MEFNKKLQELRKQKGLTQEELASALFVSRTAISKWESGRGYPSIDSLKEVSIFFGITIDELLSSDEVLTIAEETGNQKARQFRDLIFGLLDLSTVIFFFLPFLRQSTDGKIQGVSLLSLTEIAPYIKIAYFASVTAIILFGILTLALQNLQRPIWEKNKSKISLALGIIAEFLFIISLQPYAAVFLFVFLLIKVLIMLKK